MNLIEGCNEYSININESELNFLCRYVPDSEEVIIFLHGLACSRDSFINVFDQDYFPGITLLLPDFTGFGKSSKPTHFSYTLQDHALIIGKMLSVLPEWNTHIVAHSMGGAIALMLNSDIFSYVKSFANIEGNLVSEDCGLLSRSIASLSFDEYKGRMYSKHVHTFKGDKQLRFEESCPEAIYKSAVSLVTLSDSGELLNKFNNLTCRKCYFYGEENKDIPILSKLSSIPKYMIHNSGHGMMTDYPEEFYTKLKKFISNIE